MITKLGPLQTKILQYLSQTPNQNKQQVQRGLGIPDKNYPSVKNAIDVLFEKGYLKAVDMKSKKNLPIKSFRLTEQGIIYVFANNNVDFLKVMQNYESDFHLMQHYVKQAKIISDPGVLKKLIQNAAQFLLLQGDRESISMNPENMMALNTSTMLLYGRMTNKERAYLSQKVGNRKNRRLFRKVNSLLKVVLNEDAEAND